MKLYTPECIIDISISPDGAQHWSISETNAIPGVQAPPLPQALFTAFELQLSEQDYPFCQAWFVRQEQGFYKIIVEHQESPALKEVYQLLPLPSIKEEWVLVQDQAILEQFSSIVGQNQPILSTPIQEIPGDLGEVFVKQAREEWSTRKLGEFKNLNRYGDRIDAHSSPFYKFARDGITLDLPENRLQEIVDYLAPLVTGVATHFWPKDYPDFINSALNGRACEHIGKWDLQQELEEEAKKSIIDLQQALYPINFSAYLKKLEEYRFQKSYGEIFPEEEIYWDTEPLTCAELLIVFRIVLQKDAELEESLEAIPEALKIMHIESTFQLTLEEDFSLQEITNILLFLRLWSRHSLEENMITTYLLEHEKTPEYQETKKRQQEDRSVLYDQEVSELRFMLDRLEKQKTSKCARALLSCLKKDPSGPQVGDLADQYQSFKVQLGRKAGRCQVFKADPILRTFSSQLSPHLENFFQTNIPTMVELTAMLRVASDEQKIALLTHSQIKKTLFLTPVTLTAFLRVASLVPATQALTSSWLRYWIAFYIGSIPLLIHTMTHLRQILPYLSFEERNTLWTAMSPSRYYGVFIRTAGDFPDFFVEPLTEEEQKKILLLILASIKYWNDFFFVHSRVSLTLQHFLWSRLTISHLDCWKGTENNQAEILVLVGTMPLNPLLLEGKTWLNCKVTRQHLVAILPKIPSITSYFQVLRILEKKLPDIIQSQELAPFCQAVIERYQGEVDATQMERYLNLIRLYILCQSREKLFQFGNTLPPSEYMGLLDLVLNPEDNFYFLKQCGDRLDFLKSLIRTSPQIVPSFLEKHRETIAGWVENASDLNKAMRCNAQWPHTALEWLLWVIRDKLKTLFPLCSMEMASECLESQDKRSEGVFLFIKKWEIHYFITETLVNIIAEIATLRKAFKEKPEQWEKDIALSKIGRVIPRLLINFTNFYNIPRNLIDEAKSEGVSLAWPDPVDLPPNHPLYDMLQYLTTHQKKLEKTPKDALQEFECLFDKIAQTVLETPALKAHFLSEIQAEGAQAFAVMREWCNAFEAKREKRPHSPVEEQLSKKSFVFLDEKEKATGAEVKSSKQSDVLELV